MITVHALALAVTLLPAVAQAQTPPAQAGRGPQESGLTFKQLTEDTRLKTASGATFTVASGWHVAETPTLIVIQEPEKELAAAFVETVAPTVEEAIAEAWKRWKPDFALTVRQTAKPPATQGWDEVAQMAYETAAEERRVVIGTARRKGKTYYVTLIDGRSALPSGAERSSTSPSAASRSQTGQRSPEATTSTRCWAGGPIPGSARSKFVAARTVSSSTPANGRRRSASTRTSRARGGSCAQVRRLPGSRSGRKPTRASRAAVRDRAAEVLVRTRRELRFDSDGATAA